MKAVVNNRQHVFVSSTSLDLRDEREVLETAINQMRSTEFNGMEYFGSQPDKPKNVCLEEVEQSDVYVGIFADRYGWVDPESNISMTELEYRQAREVGLPCLIYLKNENVPDLFSAPTESKESLDKLAALKQELKQSHVVTFFKSPDHLATRVILDLHNLFYSKQPPIANQKITLAELRLIISLHFNLEEVKTLCFDLGVDFDDLEAVGKSGKIRELIMYMIRRKQFINLMAGLERARPDIDWRDYDAKW